MLHSHFINAKWQLRRALSKTRGFLSKHSASIRERLREWMLGRHALPCRLNSSTRSKAKTRRWGYPSLSQSLRHRCAFVRREGVDLFQQKDLQDALSGGDLLRLIGQEGCKCARVEWLGSQGRCQRSAVRG